MDNTILDSLGIQEGQHIADLGARTGKFSILLSKRVGGSGMVYAVDVNPKPLLKLVKKIRNGKCGDNITVVLGDDTDSSLDENSVDIIFSKNAFHDFIDPRSVCRNMRTILRPWGKAVIVDYKEGGGIPWLIGHFSTQERIDSFMIEAGFTRIQSPVSLPRQHYLVYSVEKGA